MLSAKPDMCIAGELRDPETQQLMQKGMHILTTSQSLYDALKDPRCDHSHSHQIIEGSTHVRGKLMLRSKFSERYPGKFARLVAQVLLKRKFPTERPIGSLVDPILVALELVSRDDQAVASDSVLTSDHRPVKRPKMSQARKAKASFADRSLDNHEDTTKRQKTSSNTIAIEQPSSEIMQHQLETIINTIEKSLPRVGKRTINQRDILNMIQSIFPDKVIKEVIACKGTERTLGPPDSIHPKEAPFRRAIMKARGTGKISIQETWEKYDCLAKRQIIRKLMPCRVNITVFADNPHTRSGCAIGANESWWWCGWAISARCSTNQYGTCIRTWSSRHTKQNCWTVTTCVPTTWYNAWAVWQENW